MGMDEEEAERIAGIRPGALRSYLHSPKRKRFLDEDDWQKLRGFILDNYQWYYKKKPGT